MTLRELASLPAFVTRDDLYVLNRGRWAKLATLINPTMSKTRRP